jgi:hypothetical protein
MHNQLIHVKFINKKLYFNYYVLGSIGCVLSEMIMGKKLFEGDSAVDQISEIIKIMGTPTEVLN